MEADPHREREAAAASVIGESLLDRDRTVHGRAGRIEGREEAVTSGLDELPSPARHECPERVVVPRQETVPGLVSECLRELVEATMSVPAA